MSSSYLCKGWRQLDNSCIGGTETWKYNYRTGGQLRGEAGLEWKKVLGVQVKNVKSVRRCKTEAKLKKKTIEEGSYIYFWYR